MLKKELVTLSVGKCRKDELKSVNADLSITDGGPELKGVPLHTHPSLRPQRCLFRAPRDLCWTLYRDGGEGEERACWEGRLLGEIWKPPANGIVGVERLIADFNSKGLSCTATYLRNARDELFTVTRLKEQGTAPEIVIVASGPVGREFRETNRRTEIGVRWTDERVERVARLLEEVRLNGTRLEF